MVAELLRGEEEMRAFVELLRPEPTADGFESEERLVICGVPGSDTWRSMKRSATIGPAHDFII